VHGNNIKPLMKDLVLDLQKEYGPTVQDYDDARWVFNVAGGSTVCSTLSNIFPGEPMSRNSRKAVQAVKLLRLAGMFFAQSVGRSLLQYLARRAHETNC